MNEATNIIGRARARDMRVTVCGVCRRLPEDCVGHVNLREPHNTLGGRLRDMHPEDIPDVPEGYRAKARKAASTRTAETPVETIPGRAIGVDPAVGSDTTVVAAADRSGRIKARRKLAPA